jgi:hypothetical protein
MSPIHFVQSMAILRFKDKAGSTAMRKFLAPQNYCSGLSKFLREQLFAPTLGAEEGRTPVPFRRLDEIKSA